MKRKFAILIIITVFAFFLGGTVLFIIIKAKDIQKPVKIPASQFVSNTERMINKIQNVCPTDLIWIGKQEGFAFKTNDQNETICLWTEPETGKDIEVPIRTMTVIDNTQLERPKKFRYEFLVINDIDGTVKLSEEEYRLIFDKYICDDRFSVMYIGKKDYKLFAEMEIMRKKVADEMFNSDKLCVLYYHNNTNGDFECITGIATKAQVANGLSLFTLVLDEILSIYDIKIQY